MDDYKREKVKNESEAIEFCKKNQCRIEFRNEMYGTPEHVILEMGIHHKTIGRDLIEAVNRAVDMYNTRPIDYEKLPWWKEQQNFYIRR